MPDFGEGGCAFTGNADLIGGETYVREANQTFTNRATLWNSSGAARVTGIGDFPSRLEKINASGIYVGPTKVPTGPTTLREGGFIGQTEPVKS